MTARRQSVEYARCLSLYPSKLYRLPRLWALSWLPQRHTHTYKNICMHTHTALWNGTFSTICILTKRFWPPRIVTDEVSQVQVPHMCVSNTYSHFLRSSVSVFVSKCVCTCVRLHWQFLLACCADPSSTPTVNPVRPGVILTLTFGRWTRDVFLLLLLPSHTFSSLVLSFPPQSHPSSRKSLTQYYGDIMGPLTALLK